MFSIQRYDFNSDEEKSDNEEVETQTTKAIKPKLTIVEQLKLKKLEKEKEKEAKRIKLTPSTTPIVQELKSNELKSSQKVILQDESGEESDTETKSLNSNFSEDLITEPIKPTEQESKPLTEAADEQRVQIENSSTIDKPDLSTDYLPVFENFNEQFADLADELEATKKVLKDGEVGLPAWVTKPTLVDLQKTYSLETTALLNSHLKARCKVLGFEELFSVQEAVLKQLGSSKRCRDILVASPTGSGKTLAYLLPLVQKLISRRIVRLRALILLPTRDLCQQVLETCTKLIAGTDLTVATACAKLPFREEQQAIVGDLNETLQGGSSKVDILICTPGRLVDHLTQTKNLTLQHLQFLVIDEADRLLNEKTFGWLNQLTLALKKVDLPNPDNLNFDNLTLTSKLGHDACRATNLDSDFRYKLPLVQPQLVQLLFSATLTRNPGKLAQLNLNNPILLTVRQNQTDSEGPTGRYVTPLGLTELFTIVNPALKAVYLLTTLLKYQIRSAILFTNSIETATNLHKFLNRFVKQLNLATQDDTNSTDPVDINESNLEPQSDTENNIAEIETNSQDFSTLDLDQVRQFLEGYQVAHFSSNLDRKSRNQLLKKFGRNEVQLLISTDLAARGIDQECQFVINYDTPAHLKNYIHRVGRTARANRLGTAISMLEPQQVKGFKSNMMQQDRKDKVKLVQTEKEEINLLVPLYKKTVRALQKIGNLKRDRA